MKFEEFMEELTAKYFDPNCEWLAVECWDVADLVDLEIMANGELQRRGADDHARTIQ